MSSTINADTTNGVIITSDTSGEIKLQSAGTDIATVDSSGITMASGKTISNSGIVTGKVLQVVQGTYSTYTSTTSTSYVDTGLTATITPTSSSSKILVLAHLQDAGKEGGNGRGNFNLVRGATEISYICSLFGYTASTAANYIGSVSTSYLDSPATTSATTYKVQWKLTGTATIYMNNSSTVSTLTLIEVAG